MLRLTRTAALAASLAVSLPLAARAQQAPGDCLQQLDAKVYAAYKAANDSGRPMDEQAVRAAQRRAALNCVGVARIDSTELQQLPALAMLFHMAADSLRTDSTARRLVRLAAARGRQSAAYYFLALVFQGEPQGDAWAARLDSLGAPALQERFELHSRLLALYRERDVDEQVMRHAKALLAMDAAIDPQARSDTSVVKALLAARKGLAEVYGDYGRVDSAVAVLDSGIRELAPLAPDTAADLRKLRSRYGMIGGPAPAVEAALWLNGPATRTIPFTGKVSVVQFTATWCPPCRHSYPEMVALQRRFAGRDFQMLFTTDLYGVFEGRKVTAAQELADDSTYFLKKNGMTFPIGIYTVALRAEGAPFENANDDRYFVTDIPQVVVVDRRGRIRHLFVGWDVGQAKRIGDVVDALLKER